MIDLRTDAASSPGLLAQLSTGAALDLSHRSPGVTPQSFSDFSAFDSAKPTFGLGQIGGDASQTARIVVDFLAER